MRVETFEEWDRRSIEVGELSHDDQRLLHELSGGADRRLEIRWLRDGRLDVRTKSWVGVIRFSGVTIHIRPKYAGGELGVIRMMAYSGGFRALKRAPGRRTLPADGANLLDVLCLLLADECETVLRDSLLQDYSTIEDALPTLRGSLRYREQATRRFGQLDVLECRFDEFHADVIENQLLRTGLAAAGRVCGSPDLKRRLRRLESTFSEVASAGPAEASIYRERLVYGRRNERYRSGHELALLLLDCLGVDDLFGSGTSDTSAFLVNMNDVFETFVTVMVAEAFANTTWHVQGQRSEASVVQNRRTGRRYSSIIPDIVLTDGMERVPFDCKYKLYGERGRKISSDDIYQTFLYAFSYGQPNQGVARAGIIYPAETTEASPELEIRRVDGPAAAELTGLSFNLLAMQKSLDDPEAWQATLGAVRQAMNRVLADVNVR